jgi:hypothetical protein
MLVMIFASLIANSCNWQTKNGDGFPAFPLRQNFSGTQSCIRPVDGVDVTIPGSFETLNAIFVCLASRPPKSAMGSLLFHLDELFCLYIDVRVQCVQGRQISNVSLCAILIFYDHIIFMHSFFLFSYVCVL